MARRMTEPSHKAALARPLSSAAGPVRRHGAVILKILVVDDDPKYRAYMQRGLTESGMACALAHDGESALDMMRKDRFDVVLLDIMLPGLQGFDVLEAMRREGMETPV